MTTIASEERYADWLAQCKELAGTRWDECSDWYSFRSAYEDDMTPEAAVKDCIDWLDN